MLNGSCLCRSVKFYVACKLPGPDAWHCSQCRKQSGHVFVSADIPRSSLKIEGSEFIKWYYSSEKVRRGFCSTCGSSLFWDPVHRDWTGVAMGAFDGPTHTKININVHVASKGDYYEITDNLPQKQ